MKNKGSKAAILVVLAVLVFSGLVLAGFGGRGRGGRPGSGFGPYGLGGHGMRAEGPGFGRGMLGGHGGDTMHMRILHRLDLTDEQNEKIKDIQNDNKDKMEAVKKAITEATKVLHEAAAEGADEAAIRAAGTKLGNAVSELAVLRATTITSIKKVLTDEQLTELKEFQEKMKERIGELRERMEDPTLRERLRQRGAEGWMGPYRGRGRGMHPMGRPNIARPFEGRGYRRGREIGRGRAPGWGWPEQGPPQRRR